MRVNKFENLKIYQIAIDIQCIGNRAVRKAQEENRRLGIPNVYSHNGVIYYEKIDQHKLQSFRGILKGADTTNVRDHSERKHK